MKSFGNHFNTVVIGAAGGIGGGLVEALSADDNAAGIFACARSSLPDLPARVTPLTMDITDERSIEKAAEQCREKGPVHLVIVASGLLHDGNELQPEKSWRSLDAERLARSFAVNSIGPALVAKHFLPLLPRGQRSVFAALSARVGSIGDNRLGGWYGYRASKAALNMLIKSLSIELARRNPSALCIGLHPGTVDTGLSMPFQSNVPEGKLFSTQRAAGQLLDVIDGAEPVHSGQTLAWDGQVVIP